MPRRRASGHGTTIGTFAITTTAITVTIGSTATQSTSTTTCVTSTIHTTTHSASVTSTQARFTAFISTLVSIATWTAAVAAGRTQVDP